MWIVKNETPDPVPLPELGVELSCKEYLDLDAHGREKAEASESVRTALERGFLRVVSKTAPDLPPLVSPPAKFQTEPDPSPTGFLRDLEENPPTVLGLPVTPKPAQPPPVTVREAFRRMSAQKARRSAPPLPEEPAATPEMAAMRVELARFRRDLLEDIQSLLDNYFHA